MAKWMPIYSHWGRSMELERGFAVVKIYTEQFAIVGKILLVEREYNRGRLSDYMNRADMKFVPLHEAYVFSLRTKKAVSSKSFMLLNKNAISLIIPAREPEDRSSDVSMEAFGLEALDS